ncbi:MAG: MFS transporter [Verrucomicrobiota bacterium]|jgi:sugar phosphate permease
MTTERQRAQRVLVIFAATLAAILYLDRVCISQSQQLIAGDLGLTKKQMGLVMTVFGVAYGLFEIPLGWLGDRVGPRRVLAWVVSWWSFFTLATGWVGGFVSLLGARFWFGAGQAGCFPNLTKAFSAWFAGADRTRVQSLMWVAARWSGAFTPLAVVAVLDVTTWRRSFFLFGSIGFVWAAMFYLWFRDRPPAQASTPLSGPAPAGQGRQEFPGAVGWVPAPWGRFFRSRSVWLLCVQYACLSYGFWFYLTWLPTYVREQFGMAQADRYLAALLAAPPLFLAGIGSWLTGWLTPRLVKRFGNLARVRRSLGATGCALACLMLLLSVRLKHPVLAMAAMGCSCFGNDMAMPGSWAGCMDLGGRFAGTLSGLMNTWGCLGGLLAPWTIPYILQAAGNHWATVIQVIAGWYFIGALSWLGIDPVTPVDRSGSPPEQKPENA